MTLKMKTVVVNVPDWKLKSKMTREMVDDLREYTSIAGDEIGLLEEVLRQKRLYERQNKIEKLKKSINETK